MGVQAPRANVKAAQAHSRCSIKGQKVDDGFGPQTATNAFPWQSLSLCQEIEQYVALRISGSTTNSAGEACSEHSANCMAPAKTSPATFSGFAARTFKRLNSKHASVSGASDFSSDTDQAIGHLSKGLEKKKQEKGKRRSKTQSDGSDAKSVDTRRSEGLQEEEADDVPPWGTWKSWKQNPSKLDAIASPRTDRQQEDPEGATTKQVGPTKQGWAALRTATLVTPNGGVAKQASESTGGSKNPRSRTSPRIKASAGKVSHLDLSSVSEDGAGQGIPERDGPGGDGTGQGIPPRAAMESEASGRLPSHARTRRGPASSSSETLPLFEGRRSTLPSVSSESSESHVQRTRRALSSVPSGSSPSHRTSTGSRDQRVRMTMTSVPSDSSPATSTGPRDQRIRTTMSSVPSDSSPAVSTGPRVRRIRTTMSSVPRDSSPSLSTKSQARRTRRTMSSDPGDFLPGESSSSKATHSELSQASGGQIGAKNVPRASTIEAPLGAKNVPAWKSRARLLRTISSSSCERQPPCGAAPHGADPDADTNSVESPALSRGSSIFRGPSRMRGPGQAEESQGIGEQRWKTFSEKKKATQGVSTCFTPRASDQDQAELVIAKAREKRKGRRPSGGVSRSISAAAASSSESDATHGLGAIGREDLGQEEGPLPTYASQAQAGGRKTKPKSSGSGKGLGAGGGSTDQPMSAGRHRQSYLRQEGTSDSNLSKQSSTPSTPSFSKPTTQPRKYDLSPSPSEEEWRLRTLLPVPEMGQPRKSAMVASDDEWRLKPLLPVPGQGEGEPPKHLTVARGGDLYKSAKPGKRTAAVSSSGTDSGANMDARRRRASSTPPCTDVRGKRAMPRTQLVELLELQRDQLLTLALELDRGGVPLVCQGEGGSRKTEFAQHVLSQMNQARQVMLDLRESVCIEDAVVKGGCIEVELALENLRCALQAVGFSGLSDPSDLSPRSGPERRAALETPSSPGKRGAAPAAGSLEALQGLGVDKRSGQKMREAGSLTQRASKHLRRHLSSGEEEMDANKGGVVHRSLKDPRLEAVAARSGKHGLRSTLSADRQMAGRHRARSVTQRSSHPFSHELLPDACFTSDTEVAEEGWRRRSEHRRAGSRRLVRRPRKSVSFALEAGRAPVYSESELSTQSLDSTRRTLFSGPEGGLLYGLGDEKRGLSLGSGRASALRLATSANALARRSALEYDALSDSGGRQGDILKAHEHQQHRQLLYGQGYASSTGASTPQPAFPSLPQNSHTSSTPRKRIGAVEETRRIGSLEKWNIQLLSLIEEQKHELHKLEEEADSASASAASDAGG